MEAAGPNAQDGLASGTTEVATAEAGMPGATMPGATMPGATMPTMPDDLPMPTMPQETFPARALPLAAEPAVQPAAQPTLPPDDLAASGAASTSLLIFEPDRARLALLLGFYRRRVRVALWLVGLGVALGLLWLLPAVRAFPIQTAPSQALRILRDLTMVSKGQPGWAVALRVPALAGPLLAVLGLLWLPGALWREARLRRQSDLHLALGRQGLLFFLPGRAERWFLLPWAQIAQMSEEYVRPGRGRLARLRTRLWRRWARLARLYRHGRRLEAGKRAGRAVVSPFAARAAMQRPRLRLMLWCEGLLPRAGYAWLFQLAPCTPRLGPEAFLLETDWFVPASPHEPLVPARPQWAAQAGASALHEDVVALWGNRALSDTYQALPLPRVDGAFVLAAPGSAPSPAEEARPVRLAAWAMLPLLPALALTGLGQLVEAGQAGLQMAALNAGVLSVLALGLALCFAGVRRQGRAGLLWAGVLLLALGGLLNVGNAVLMYWMSWPWSFHDAPAPPWLALEGAAGLLVVLGALALALEGSGQPGAERTPDTAHVLPRIHSAEVVLGLGLLALGLGRVLEDVNLAVLSQSDSVALQLLRNTLAEPLVPLAIVGVCYFGALVSAGVGQVARVLQAVYGLVLALLAPLGFLLVQRALFGAGLPLAGLPLLALLVLGGLLAVWGALRGLRARRP